MRTHNSRLSPPAAHAVAVERVGTRLRELRTAERYSQAGLAEAMTARGFSWHQTTVYRIESGRRELLLTEAEAVTELLRVPLTSLTGKAAS